jgi:hypothetical protein
MFVVHWWWLSSRYVFDVNFCCVILILLITICVWKVAGSLHLLHWHFTELWDIRVDLKCLPYCILAEIGYFPEHLLSYICSLYSAFKPIPAAARSKEQVCGRLVAGSNPARGMDVCLLCFYIVLSCVGRGLCDWLITRREESYRVYVCVWSRNPEKGGQRSILDYKRLWMNSTTRLYKAAEKNCFLYPDFHGSFPNWIAGIISTKHVHI